MNFPVRSFDEKSDVESFWILNKKLFSTQSRGNKDSRPIKKICAKDLLKSWNEKQISEDKRMGKQGQAVQLLGD